MDCRRGDGGVVSLRTESGKQGLLSLCWKEVNLKRGPLRIGPGVSENKSLVIQLGINPERSPE